jgi:hypothetical protein
MIQLDAARPARFCDGLRRRDFLHAGTLGLLGLSLSDLFAVEAAGAVRPKRDVNCIALMLVGGPSHLDTWDMKPHAPREVRGALSPIRTTVAGMRISEIFPRMATHAEKFALLRSVHAPGVTVHDAGHQVMQTGRAFQAGLEHPHVGSVVGYVKGARGDTPAHVVLPQPIGRTGGNMPHGQSAGFLGAAYDPWTPYGSPSAWSFGTDDSRLVGLVPAVQADRPYSLRSLVDDAVKRFEQGESARSLVGPAYAAHARLSSSRARGAFDLSREPGRLLDRYGRTRFGLSCLLARRLVEAGVRFVTVNMFETVFHQTTWDVHGAPPFSPLAAHENELGPIFDNAYSSLIEDLDARGLLGDTLVVAMGEFGRTPRINADGGRDHWPHCWTVVMAGGGVKGGQVIGASDEIGAYPKDRPIPAAAIPATILHALGIDRDTTLPGPRGEACPVIEPGIEPVTELF